MNKRIYIPAIILSSLSGAIYLVLRSYYVANNFTVTSTLALLVEMFGVFSAVIYLYLLKVKQNKKVNVYTNHEADILLDARDADIFTLNRSLVALNQVINKNNVYVITDKKSSQEEIVNSFSFNIINEDEYLNSENKSAYVLLAKCNEVLYPDAIIRAFECLETASKENESLYCELSSSTQTDYQNSKISVLNDSLRSHEFSIYSNGPLLVNVLTLTEQKINIQKSRQKLVIELLKHNIYGKSTKEACCEILDLDTNSKESNEIESYVKFSKSLMSNLTNVLKGAPNLYTKLFLLYSATSFLRGIRTALVFISCSIYLLSRDANSLINTQMLLACAAFYTVSVLFTYVHGDKRSIQQRISQAISECEASLRILIPIKIKYSISAIVLSTINLTFALRIILENVTNVYDKQSLADKNTVYAVGMFAIISLSVSMKMLFTKSNRSGVRRVVSINGEMENETIVITDLTDKGAGILSGRIFNLGEEIQVEFEVPTLTSKQIVKVKGKVRNIVNLVGKQKYGIEFDSASKTSLNAITYFTNVLFPYSSHREEYQIKQLVKKPVPKRIITKAHAKPQINRQQLLSRVASILILIAIAFSMVQAFRPATAAPSDPPITGTVWLDLNGDAKRADPGYITDTGYQGATITAYDSIGSTPVSTVSGPSGTYSLNVTTLGPGPFRLELTVPAGYTSAPIGLETISTVRQSVSAGASGIDFAIEDPDTYCAANPRIFVTCFASGNGNLDPSGKGAGATPIKPSTKSFRFDDEGYPGSPTYVEPTTIATYAQTGSVYGLAYSKTTGKVYESAFLRRHSAYGPQGPGAIYEVNPDTGIVLRTINIANPGTEPSSRDLSVLTKTKSRDIDAFGKVGKQAIGDIDVVGDGKTLFATNLNTRELVRVDALDTVSPTQSTFAIPATISCLGGNNDRRMFGLGSRRVEGVIKLYVGITCTGETRYLKSDLASYILEFDVASNTWGSSILSIPLDYAKGCAQFATPTQFLGCEWNPWSDDESKATHVASVNNFLVSNPQPVISDIQFDQTGAIIIGIADRGGWQWGISNYPPLPDTSVIPGWSFDHWNQEHTYFAAGDQLRACPDLLGIFILESNASCGGSPATAGAGSSQGPGGGEYYWGDSSSVTNLGITQGHEELGLGAFAFVPGRTTMLATATDPYLTRNGIDVFRGNSIGIVKLAHTTDASTGQTAGAWVNKLELGNFYSGTNDFAKAGGLGDLEVLCENAPLEIGNYVWNDVNRNGIQDPNEQPIEGVSVSLFDTVSNSVVATAKTGIDGKYLFASEGVQNTEHASWDDPIVPGDDDPNDPYGIVLDPDSNLGNAVYGIKENRQYEVRFDVSTATNSTFHSALLTTVNTDGSANGDARDSDAILVSNIPTVSLTTGIAGENNHTFDVGFVNTYSIGNRVWNDINNDGLDNNNEPGISSVNTRLYSWTDSNNDSNVQAGELSQVLTGADGILGNAGDSSAAVVTNANGYYRFSNLYPGNYIVEVDTPANYVSSSGTNASLTGPYESANFPTADIADGDVNANDDGNKFSASTTRSRPYTLGGSVQEPIGEKEVGDTISDITSDNSSNLSVDFGFYIKAKLGDYVWNDINNDGVQNSGEPGTNGVNVTLRQPGTDNTIGTSDDVIVATTSTSDDPNTAGIQNGWYYFDYLNPGNYFVTFSNMPASSIFTTKDSSSATDTTDSDADTLTGRTIVTSLTAGEDDPSWDAGWFVPNMSVGNRVWIDTNHNGLDDNGESGYQNAQVKLFNSGGTQIQTGADGVLGTSDDGTAPVSTNANGYYLFTQLVPGTYYIEVTNISSDYISTTNTSDVSVDSVERDDNGVTVIAGGVRSAQFTLSLNAEPANDDASTSGWTDNAFDSNSNYTLDFGFYKEFDLSISKTITNLVDSPFSFGDYVNYSVTVKNEGPGDAEAGYVIVDTLPSGIDPSTIDITGASGFTSSVSGSVITFTSTAGLTNGGTKTVTYRAKVDAIPTAPSVDRTNNVYVDKSPSDRDEIIRLNDVPTNNKDDAIFPLAAGSSIGDRVWYDADRDGLQDSNEVGVSGVNVELFRFNDANSDGNVDSGELVSIATDTSDANGYYGSTKGTASFQNLSPNFKYKVIFSNVPSGYRVSPQGANGSTPALSPNGSPIDDSDADLNTLETDLTLLSANETDLTWDLGIYRETASIGDRVWYDSDRDGIQDSGEIGKSGVIVNLYKWTDSNSNGNIDSGETSTAPFATDTTNSSGNYLFDNLDPGLYPTKYMVEFILPVGYQYSIKNAAGSTASSSPNDSPTNDSDADITNGQTKYTSLNPNEYDPTFDAGIYLIPAQIGNKVFYDLNEDGIQDPGEGPVENVTVELLSSTGTVLANDVTDANGVYGFDNLEPGDYSVKFVLSSLPFGYAATLKNQSPNAGDSDSDADRISGETILTTLNPGENDPSWDLGIVPRAAIGDRIWYDNNRNGVQDEGEKGVPGISLNLLNADGAVVATKLSDANGIYNFTDLPIGDYEVQIVLSTIPGGYILTSKNANGSTIDNDSNANTSNGKMGLTNLTVGENDISFDAGIYQPTASLGDYVWFDTNTDGVQDEGEKGVSDVTVKLYDSTSGLFVKSTITDSNGKYLFNNLEPGDYYLEFILPKGYSVSDKNTATISNDSDIDKTTKKTISINLSPGENDMTWDAGIYDSTVVRGTNVENKPVKTTSNKLPFTGSETLSLLIAAISVLFSGFLLWGLFKRRGQAA